MVYVFLILICVFKYMSIYIYIYTYMHIGMDDEGGPGTQLRDVLGCACSRGEDTWGPRRFPVARAYGLNTPFRVFLEGHGDLEVGQ